MSASLAMKSFQSIYANQMEASPTNQLVVAKLASATPNLATSCCLTNFVTNEQTFLKSKGQQILSSAEASGVGELLKLTNLNLNDELPLDERKSKQENDNNNNQQSYSNYRNQQQLTGGPKMLVGLNERPRKPESVEERQVEEQNRSQIRHQQQHRATPLGNNPQNFHYQNLSTGQHGYQSNHNYPTFVDHHHQQQQLSACEQEAHSNPVGLEYHELESGGRPAAGSQLELPFNHSPEQHYKTANYTALDAVGHFPMLDCSDSDVIRVDYPADIGQHVGVEQASQCQYGGNQSGSFGRANNKQLVLLQQHDSGHASSVSCVDSASSGASLNHAPHFDYPTRAHHYTAEPSTQQELLQAHPQYHEIEYSSQSGQAYHRQPHQHQQHQHQQQQLNQPSSEIVLAEPELKVCEWEGCENTFLDMGEFVKHLEDKHVNQPPREKNRYFCLWSNCKRNEQEFNARYKLLIHMRVHSGEKPYPCSNEHCKKSFSRLENLKIHVRSHTGEKPYKCTFTNCSKSFTNSSDRIKHHKTHRDPKPYSCNFSGCAKRYTDPSSLRKHLRTHKVRLGSDSDEMGVANNPTFHVTLAADFDPNALLESQERDTSFGSAGKLPDCDHQYSQLEPSHSFSHYSTHNSASDLNQSNNTLDQHQTGYQQEHFQQAGSDSLHHQQQLQLEQQQHRQFSRSWCAGYTSRPPALTSVSSSTRWTPGLASGGAQWPQSEQNSTNSSTLDCRWLSPSRAQFVGSQTSQLELAGQSQHESLMRSLPPTSFARPFPQHQHQHTQRWSARLEWDQHQHQHQHQHAHVRQAQTGDERLN